MEPHAMSATAPGTKTSERDDHSPASSANGNAPHDLSVELLRLRERFGAYERLDHQLDEMVSGLTELLKGAAELRRRTNDEITTALGRLEGLIAEDRAQQRQLLASISNDLDAAQRRTSTIATSVATVQGLLADLTHQLQPAEPHKRANETGQTGWPRSDAPPDGSS